MCTGSGESVFVTERSAAGAQPIVYWVPPRVMSRCPFTCDVKLSGGGKAEVTVTQTSDHNTFSYALKSGSLVLPGSEVDKQIEQELADAGVKDTTVNCPDEVPVKTGTTVTCPVTGAGGNQATVSFQFSDSSGTVDSSSVEES